MKAPGAWAVAGVVVGFAACTQSYDDFDFSGTTPTGGTGGTTTTTTGVGGSPAGTTTGAGTGGGTGTPTGGTGGNGLQGGSAGTGGTGGSAGTGGTGGGPLSCTDQYTHGNIYELCVESAAECEFRVRTNNGENCEDICQAGGGECLEFYNDFPNGSCNRGSQETCTTEYSSAICICSHGCGTGPPCVAPQVCTGGNCS